MVAGFGRAICGETILCGQAIPARPYSVTLLQTRREEPARKLHSLCASHAACTSHLGEDGDVVSVAEVFQEVEPGACPQKIYVLGEGREDATGEKFSNLLGEC
jgi:hypothetical protein